MDLRIDAALEQRLAGIRALGRAELRPLALRCQFMAATHRFEAAVRDCGRYLERHPDDAALHFAQGVALEGVGRRADAEQSYRRAAALDPQAVDPRNNLGLLLAARGDLDGALAAAQEAFALAGESPEVLDTLGWLYLQKGLVPRAISLLEDAHRRGNQEPCSHDRTDYAAGTHREART